MARTSQPAKTCDTVVYVPSTEEPQVNKSAQEARVLVSTRVSTAGLKEIDAIAKAEGRTRADVVRRLLSEAVAARKRDAGRRGR